MTVRTAGRTLMPNFNLLNRVMALESKVDELEEDRDELRLDLSALAVRILIKENERRTTDDRPD